MKNLHYRSKFHVAIHPFLLLLFVLLVSSVPGELLAQNSPPSGLKGVVLDEGDAPLIGANVYVKGTTRGTVANEKGEFSLEVLPGEIVVFTYVGYQIQEYTVPSQVPDKLTIRLQYHAEIVAEPATDKLYSSSEKKME